MQKRHFRRFPARVNKVYADLHTNAPRCNWYAVYETYWPVDTPQCYTGKSNLLAAVPSLAIAPTQKKKIRMLQALLYAVPLLMLIFFIQELIQPIDKRWSSLNRYSLPAGPTGSLAVGNLLEFWRHRSNGSMATYVSRPVPR